MNQPMPYIPPSLRRHHLGAFFAHSIVKDLQPSPEGPPLDLAVGNVYQRQAAACRLVPLVVAKLTRDKHFALPCSLLNHATPATWQDTDPFDHTVSLSTPPHRRQPVDLRHSLGQFLCLHPSPEPSDPPDTYQGQHILQRNQVKSRFFVGVCRHDRLERPRPCAFLATRSPSESPRPSLVFPPRRRMDANQRRE